MVILAAGDDADLAGHATFEVIVPAAVPEVSDIPGITVEAGRTATVRATLDNAAAAGAVAWNTTGSKPAWVSVDASTGLLTAALPADATPQNYTVTLTASNPAGTGSAALDVAVVGPPAQPPAQPPEAPRVSYIPELEAAPGQTISHQAALTNAGAAGNVTWSVHSGPDWVTVDHAGLITAHPPQGALESAYAVMLSAANQAGEVHTQPLHRSRPDFGVMRAFRPYQWRRMV